MKAWLKGGLIGGIIYPITIFLVSLVSKNLGIIFGYPVFLSGESISKLCLIKLCSQYTVNGGECMLEGVICGIITFIPLAIISGFIIGALIGLIISKVRSGKTIK